MRESIRLARAVFSQPSFAPFCAGEMEPGADFQSDAELDDFAARKGDSSYHPSCTCRMGDSSEGGRDGAVVDAKTMGVIGGFYLCGTSHFLAITRHCRTPRQSQRRATDPVSACMYSDAHKGVSALISELLFWYPDFCRILELARRHSSDIGQF